MDSKWVDFYMELAQFVADRLSKDPTSKVGTVIVAADDQRKLAFGYNGFPPGIKDDERLEDRRAKHMLIQHAERNALDNAAFDIRGGTLVTTRYPCHECAKSIVSKGISRVATPPPPADPLWQESSEWAAKILQEAGVQVTLVPPR